MMFSLSCFLVLVKQSTEGIGEFFIVLKFPHCEHDRMNQLVTKGLVCHLFAHPRFDRDFLRCGVAESVLADVV